MMKKTVMAVTALLLVSGGAVQAQEQVAAETATGGSWIHVRVDEDGGEKVDINLPLSLIDVALDIGETEGFDADDLRFGPESDISVQDLRRMWKQLRDAGDAEFVNVRDGDEHVRLYRRGDRVRVDVDEGGQAKVRVDMPAAIVDALLGAEGDRLDLTAAARALAETGEQEVVRIDDEGTRVRVWVDRVSAASGS